MLLTQINFLLFMLLNHVFLHLAVEVLDLLRLLHCLSLGRLFFGFHLSGISDQLLLELSFELFNLGLHCIPFASHRAYCGLLCLGLLRLLRLELLYFCLHRAQSRLMGICLLCQLRCQLLDLLRDLVFLRAKCLSSIVVVVKSILHLANLAD